MKKPLALILLFSASLLMAGCTDADWDNALNFTGMKGEAEETPAAPQEAQSATVAAAPAAMGEPANNAFCRSLAEQDATGGDFDPATQKAVFARSYAQCLTIYTR